MSTVGSAAAKEGAVASLEHFRGERGIIGDQVHNPVDALILFLEETEKFGRNGRRRRQMFYAVEEFVDLIHDAGGVSVYPGKIILESESGKSGVNK